jgi:hypothetical protein
MTDASPNTPRPFRVTGWMATIFDQSASALPGRPNESPVPLFACRFCGRLFAGPHEQHPEGFAHECSASEPLTVVVNKFVGTGPKEVATGSR